VIFFITIFVLFNVGFSQPNIKIITDDIEVTVGDSIQLLAVYIAPDDSEVDTLVVWTISPDSLGFFKENGLLIATSIGRGRITATLDTLSDSTKVKIEDHDADDDEKGHESGRDQCDLVITPGDTVLQVGESLQFNASYRDSTGALTDTTAQWSVKGQIIGTVSQDGLLQVLQPGMAFVKASLNNCQTTSLVTAVDTTEDETGINTVSITRVLPGDHVLPARDFQEGHTFALGGLPFPLNILNGTHVYFPMGSLGEDISIRIQLPKFASVGPNEVLLKEDLVTGVTFEVYVDGELVELYFFEKPVTVVLPFKRGLIDTLGINIADLTMYYSEDGESFDDIGITNIVVDSSRNRIFAQVEHFSTLVVKPAETAVAVENTEQTVPQDFALNQNYPNPFNPETTIRFELPHANQVKLTVYNLLGQEVVNLVDEYYQPGFHVIGWNGNDNEGRSVATGIYLFKMEAGKFSQVKKMTLLR
jgi:hypothetical protein